jgi:hypothetical protein
MNAHSLRITFRRQNLVTTAVLLSSVFVLAFGFAAYTARPSQEGQVNPEANERRFENTVPEHVPLKVKLKSEKSFKDLKNKGWARELEIEVTNTGSKPIYYLYVIIVMPDMLVNGHRLTMRTTYGRAELGLPETPVEPDDVPVLLPGETLTVKLPERKVSAYERSRDAEGRHDPKVVEFEIQVVKFGDGTSFRGRAGKPWSEATKKQSSNATPPDADTGGCRPPERSKEAEPLANIINAAFFSKPASLMRAYSLLPDYSLVSAKTSASDDCGCWSVSGCMWGNIGWSNCPCDSQVPAVTFGGGCGNTGQCLAYVTSTEKCDTEYNGTQYCTYDDYTGKPCRLTDPMPTPTRTPTPTPTPTASPTPVPCPCANPNVREPNRSCHCTHLANGDPY